MEADKSAKEHRQMEQEFKWDAFATLQDAVLIWALNRDADHAKIDRKSVV